MPVEGTVRIGCRAEMGSWLSLACTKQRIGSSAQRHAERPRTGGRLIGETYPGLSLASWNGFLLVARTPREIVDKLAKHVVAAANDPANVAQLTALGIEPGGTTPEEFLAQINLEQPQFDDAIKAANLKAE
jgi:hypothetical protein